MKRVKVISAKPNPLFELWLEEWKQEAASRNSDLQYHFSKALASLRKYPLPLKSGKDCIILQHFGTKLCSMLDNKLEKHKAQNTDFANDNNFICIHCKYVEQHVLKRKKKSCKKTVNNEHALEGVDLLVFEKINLQAWDVENYAALFILYKKSQHSNYSGFITEMDLLSAIEELCGYANSTAILNLVESGLVSMTDTPIRYNLTESGINLVRKIYEVTDIDEKLSSVDVLYKVQVCLKKLFEQNLVSANYLINANTNKQPPSSEKGVELIPNIVDKTNENCSKQKAKQCNIGSKKLQEKAKKTKNMNNCVTDKIENNKADSIDSVEREIYLQSHKFDIILLVDTQEISGGKTKPQHDATITELTELGVLFEVRHLKVGDFAWIARCRTTNEELILPYIIERKRIDDLSASITDGRFHEQKFRLKQCGIENLMYIIEEYDKGHRLAIPHSSLMQASINTLIQDGFSVKYTKTHKASMFYLSSLSRILIKTFKAKNLKGCKKESFIQTNIAHDCISLMEFKEFNKAASKYKVFSVRQMFIRQLLQLKGMSVEKALAVAERYSTPNILFEALHSTDSNGELLLSTVEFGNKKRLLGPVISKTIYQLYTRKNLN